MTAENPKAVYACVNQREAYAPKEIAERSICINADIGGVLCQLIGKLNKNACSYINGLLLVKQAVPFS